MPTAPELLTAFFGTAVAGAAVTVLPLPPVVLDPAAVARGLVPTLNTSGIRHLVVLGAGEAIGAELAGQFPRLKLICPAALAAEPKTSGMRRADPAPDSLALVQFSSGSTTRPKGVMLTHQAFLTGVSAINAHIGARSDDVLVSWVPLFHDLGLVGLMCSLLSLSDAHVFSPLTFIRHPDEFLRHLGRVGGTVTTGPNFAYDRLARAAASAFGTSPADAPLSRWRLALIGAEMVQGRTLDRFDAAFAPLGVPSSALCPCYGMAEATLAVTMPPLGQTPRRLSVDRSSLVPGGRVRLAAPGIAGSWQLTALGVPVPGIQLRVAGESGTALPEDTLGEICIRGPATTTGYLRDEEATRQALRGGWLHTGDLGLLHHGELYVAGRTKDMIAVQGRNFYPDDVEEATRGVADVHRGHCVAVADPLTEQMVIVAEAAGGDGHERLADDIRGAVSNALGLVAVRVVVPPRTLPRTTSGKWQRSLVREFLTAHTGTEGSEGATSDFTTGK